MVWYTGARNRCYGVVSDGLTCTIVMNELRFTYPAALGVHPCINILLSKVTDTPLYQILYSSDVLMFQSILCKNSRYHYQLCTEREKMQRCEEHSKYP